MGWKARTAALMVLLVGVWWLVTASWSEYHALQDSSVRFSAVYIASPDPQALAQFYQAVFQAEVVEAGYLASLKTQGYGERGPLLHFLQASVENNSGPLRVYESGYAHLCVEAEHVPAVVRRVRAAGGTVLSTFDDPERVPGIYVMDPDGNVIEIHVPFPTPLTPSTLWRTGTALLSSMLDRGESENDVIRFLHVNINTPDWQKLVAFYEQALGAASTGFKRDYHGSFIERMTGVDGAVVRGRHVALPGYSVGGPTAEIFTYNRPSDPGRPGLADTGRVAVEFTVQDVQAMMRSIVAAGGHRVEKPDIALPVATDVDGNLIVLRQSDVEQGR